MSVEVTLNGRRTSLECEPTDMLLDVLRDHHGLGSVRETCRIGVCGRWLRLATFLRGEANTFLLLLSKLLLLGRVDELIE